MIQDLKPRTYLLPLPLLKRLGKCAEDLGISRQEIVRRALEAYLEAINQQDKEMKKND